jgi:hypothetical protein
MVSIKGAHFATDMILTCAWWYVAYPLSYRHAEKTHAGTSSIEQPYDRQPLGLEVQSATQRRVPPPQAPGLDRLLYKRLLYR